MARGPMAMPYRGRDVPHAVIEVNRECNISCTACYKARSKESRSVEAICADIDTALSLRRLSMITLAGGEPSLHPGLAEVIAYAARRRLTVQMLSNGYGLDEGKLARYRQAGLDTLYLHLDMLQHRPDAPRARSEADLDPLRTEILDRVDRSGVHGALAMTLYQKNLAELPSVVQYLIESPHASRLLITCCRDFVALGGVKPDQGAPNLAGEQVSNAEVKALLLDRLGMEPFAYVASSDDPRAERWLLYYAFVASRGGRRSVLHATPRFARAVRLSLGLTKGLTGRYPFGETLSGPLCRVLCASYAAMSFEMAAWRTVLQSLLPGWRLAPKSFCFQEGPTHGPHGIAHCLDCPDATVRNGRLVPVCLADSVPAEQLPIVA